MIDEKFGLLDIRVKPHAFERACERYPECDWTEEDLLNLAREAHAFGEKTGHLKGNWRRGGVYSYKNMDFVLSKRMEARPQYWNLKTVI